MSLIHEIGDEGLGRKYGPCRAALWFDEQEDYRYSNERFWRIRRTLLHSDIWDTYDVTSIPLIPEWFGSLLPHERAYRESGYPSIWCVVLGFPSTSLRDRALELIQAAGPAGLVKVEDEPPDPSEYSLPLIGFLAKQVYLTLEPDHPRRYDTWEGYETVGLVGEMDGMSMEVADLDLAEHMLLRRLTLSTGRHLKQGSGYDGLVEHARELWAMKAIAAAGAVAGTAMELLLARSLPDFREWALQATLGPLIDKTVKEHKISAQQAEILHGFRELRNSCAHALSDSEASALNGQLASGVHKWLEWLEGEDADSVASDGPGGIEEPIERPNPAALHAEADAAARAAAEACTPRPMKLADSAGRVTVDAEGVCGDAEVLITPSTDPLACWLIAEGHAEEREGTARLWVFWPTQSMERAATYAKTYVDILLGVDVPASYRTYID